MTIESALNYYLFIEILMINIFIIKAAGLVRVTPRQNS